MSAVASQVEPAADSAPGDGAAFPRLPLWRQLAETQAATYHCPGEPHPISRPVHLARLAAFYSKCRSCPHAVEVGAIPRPQPSTGASSVAAATAAELFTRDGVRGVHRNVIDRERAGRIAAQLAAEVWRRFPLRAAAGDDPPLRRTSPPAAPAIVVGRDARPASADIAAGVVPALRRMGCQVIDLACVSRPAVDYAVHHLQAAAGVHVTGAGCHSSWVGLEVVDADGVPWSNPGRLAALAERLDKAVQRPTRRGGTLRSFDVELPLRVDFARRRLGLPPIRIGLQVDCPVQRRWLADWFGPLAGSFFAWPGLTPTVHRPDAPRHLRRELRNALRELDLRFAIHIAEDGRQVRVWDEQGRPLPASVWLVRLTESALAGGLHRRVVVSEDLPAIARGRLQALGAEVDLAGRDHEILVRRLLESQALLAADGDGRMWFREHSPVCDGLVTTAALLRLAAETPGAVSQWGA